MDSVPRKQKLCARLSALSPPRAKDVYGVISEHFKNSTVIFPKRLGVKVTVPFGGKQLGDDYEFAIDNFPPSLIQDIERLLDSE